MKHKILIIDDDPGICQLLKRLFIRHDFDVAITGLGKKGLEELEKNPPDIAICDLRLPDIDGKDFLLKSRQLLPGLPVIIITGYGDIKVAVDLMKNGAIDYVTKPILPDELVATVNRAIQANGLTANLVATEHNHGFTTIQPAPKKNSKAKYIFGDSIQFKQILEQINLVAPTSYSIIISGESGSGKEAIAHEIHARSKRSNQPFIAIDCGALSKELAGSELFGHEKGSFTGAANQKTGSLELANGGTVFLDEVSNLSYDIQASLLRVVQERKLRRVGGIKDIDLDIRIIVASNDQLAETARQGTFREDLYFRFNEFSIHVPPLRERQNDILTFAHFFLDQCNHELERNVKGFAPDVQQLLKAYRWPGNLRELKNVVKRATLLAFGDYIEANALPHELFSYNKNHPAINIPEPMGSPENNLISDDFVNLAATAETPIALRRLPKHDLKSVSIDAEYTMIVAALKKSNFNKSKAAKLLNVDRKTLYNKMKLHNEYSLKFSSNGNGT